MLNIKNLILMRVICLMGTPQPSIKKQIGIPSSTEDNKINLPVQYDIQRSLLTKYSTPMSPLLFPSNHSQTDQINWPLSG